MLNSSRDKNEGTYRSGEGGEKSLLCDPGSELRLRGERDRSAKIINGMKNENGDFHEKMSWFLNRHSRKKERKNVHNGRVRREHFE